MFMVDAVKALTIRAPLLHTARVQFHELPSMKLTGVNCLNSKRILVKNDIDGNEVVEEIEDEDLSVDEDLSADEGTDSFSENSFWDSDDG